MRFKFILAASISYIYIPVFIFLFGFTKLYIALIVSACLGYTMESYANRELDIPLDLKYNYYSYDIQNNIFYKYIAAKKYE